MDSDPLNDPTEPDPNSLPQRLLATFARGAGSPLEDREFDVLALDVFAYQFERNPIFRAYCVGRGATPAMVTRWIDIPAVPTDAFKSAPLVCGNRADAAAVFRTSGTTGGPRQRGVHYLLDTALYRASLLEGFRHALLPDRQSIRILSLVASYRDVPDSSLSFMVQEVVETFGAPESTHFATADTIDADGLIEELREAERDGEAVLLAGTSLAFAYVFELMSARDVALSLPAGSRAMDTGGSKGNERGVDRSELYGSMSRRLGIPASYVINEYGMTELSSQFYDGVAGSAGETGAQRLHRGPGWVRTVAVDPETLEPRTAGETGILRHVDLANLHSVAAIQTADLGRVEADGVVLSGRATGAPPRGCSIATNELLELMRGR